jgi:DNA modification methylase
MESRDMSQIATKHKGTTHATPAEIDALDRQLAEKFRDKFLVQPSLTRQLVSFQANKSRATYRWYKYKEAFSASLVEFLLTKYGISASKVLDPFAGSGTTLFAACERGLDADGIELLPIGQQIIKTRLCLERNFTTRDFTALGRWAEEHPWKGSGEKVPLPALRITEGAYPKETADAIERYLGALGNENECVQNVLRFALLCVLESISYTRKDGQYLRWDYRSGRKQGARKFDKGRIVPFDEAIRAKIKSIVHDVRVNDKLQGLFPAHNGHGNIRLFEGSCLEILPELPRGMYDAILTSPPYCNRYDYTRTYALELALLGAGEQELRGLRQTMLSCTVENRAKDLLAVNPKWADTLAVVDNQELLQAILRFLEQEKADGKLNNNCIPRMVTGYFQEMACVISECARVMKRGAQMFMVNDNVRYAGASISVDMILSRFAEELGFKVENILVLPTGKGNSSQQMGLHGRDVLRKCVYVWRKK